LFFWLLAFRVLRESREERRWKLIKEVSEDGLIRSDRGRASSLSRGFRSCGEEAVVGRPLSLGASSIVEAIPWL
jgi:hypothetical protein